MRVSSERLGYSAQELADAVGCSVRHIKNMIAAGEIPHVKLRSRTIIPAWWTRLTFERQQIPENELNGMIERELTRRVEERMAAN